MAEHKMIARLIYGCSLFQEKLGGKELTTLRSYPEWSISVTVMLLHSIDIGSSLQMQLDPPQISRLSAAKKALDTICLDLDTVQLQISRLTWNPVWPLQICSTSQINLE